MGFELKVFRNKMVDFVKKEEGMIDTNQTVNVSEELSDRRKSY